MLLVEKIRFKAIASYFPFIHYRLRWINLTTIRILYLYYLVVHYICLEANVLVWNSANICFIIIKYQQMIIK